MADDPSTPFAEKVHGLVASALEDLEWDKLAGPVSEAAFEYATAAIASDSQKGMMLWYGDHGLQAQVYIMDRAAGATLIEGQTIDLIDILRLETAYSKTNERAEWRVAVERFYRSALKMLEE